MKVICGFLAAIVGFIMASCSVLDDNTAGGGGTVPGAGGLTPAPISAIGFLHAAPDSPSTLVGVDNPGGGNTVNFGFFSGYTVYASGDHRVTFASATNSKVIVADTTLPFQPQGTYTLFLFNKANGAAKILAATDVLGVTGQNNAAIRFAHLSSGIPDVKVLIVGQAKQLADQQRFLEVSTFAEYLGQQCTMEVRAVNDNHLIISKVIDIVPTKFYTVVLTGPASAPKLSVSENK